MTLLTSLTAGGFDAFEEAQRTGLSRKSHGIHPRGSAWDVVKKRATAAEARARKIFMGGGWACLSRYRRGSEIPRYLLAHMRAGWPSSPSLGVTASPRRRRPGTSHPARHPHRCEEREQLA